MESYSGPNSGATEAEGLSIATLSSASECAAQPETAPVDTTAASAQKDIRKTRQRATRRTAAVDVSVASTEKEVIKTNDRVTRRTAAVGVAAASTEKEERRASERVLRKP